MKALKELGHEDAERIKRRALKARAMGRVAEKDADMIIDLADQIMAHIVGMREEIPGNRREF